jgi:hypothetical protein
MCVFRSYNDFEIPLAVIMIPALLTHVRLRICICFCVLLLSGPIGMLTWRWAGCCCSASSKPDLGHANLCLGMERKKDSRLALRPTIARGTDWSFSPLVRCAQSDTRPADIY